MKKLYLALLMPGVIAYGQTNYSGNVGINEPNPQATLHVKGTLRLDNPSKSDNAVLRVFKDGSMKWKKLFLVEPVRGDKTDAGTAGIDTSTTPKYAGFKITLPTGRWIVKLNLLIPQIKNYWQGRGFWVNAYLSDSKTNSSPTSDYLVNSSKYFSGGVKYPAPYGMVVGGVVINNTQESKTYYLWVFHETFPSTASDMYSNTLGADGWYEDKIYAIPFE